jgi:hypothetical protein
LWKPHVVHYRISIPLVAKKTETWKWTCAIRLSKYKVVQIWSGLFVCKQVTVCPGHIWTTLYNLKLSWQLNSINILKLIAKSGDLMVSKPTFREPSLSSSGNWLEMKSVRVVTYLPEPLAHSWWQGKESACAESSTRSASRKILQRTTFALIWERIYLKRRELNKVTWELLHQHTQLVLLLSQHDWDMMHNFTAAQAHWALASAIFHQKQRFYCHQGKHHPIMSTM